MAKNIRPKPAQTPSPWSAQMALASPGMLLAPYAEKAAEEALQNRKRYGVTTANSQNVYLTPEALDEMQSGVRNMGVVDEQEQAMRDYERVYNQAQAMRPVQVDLSPLGNLAQAWSRNPRFKAPDLSAPSYDQDMDMALKFAQDRLNRRQDLAKQILDITGGLKAGTTTTTTVDTADISESTKDASKSGVRTETPSKGDSGGTSKLGVGMDRLVRSFNAENKEDLDLLKSLRTMDVNLKTRSWLQDSNLKSVLVKAAQLFPVSDRDVSRYEGSQDLLSQAKRLQTRLMEGESFLEEDRAVIKQFVQHMRDKAVEKLNESTGRFAEARAPYEKIPPADFIKAVQPKEGWGGAGYKSEKEREKEAEKKAQDLQQKLIDAIKGGK